MKYLSFFIILLLFINACSNNQKNANTIEEPEATPDLFTNNGGELIISSFNKRRGGNLIESLFEEATNKVPELRSLTDDILALNELERDSLEDYQIYSDTNSAYWQSLKAYIGKINDSTMRNDMEKLMVNWKENYESKAESLTILNNDIGSRKTSLNDHELLLKILVTQPMIANYQKNELPNMKPLQFIKQSYDTLISETQSYLDNK